MTTLNSLHFKVRVDSSRQISNKRMREMISWYVLGRLRLSNWELWKRENPLNVSIIQGCPKFIRLLNVKRWWAGKLQNNQKKFFFSTMRWLNVIWKYKKWIIAGKLYEAKKIWTSGLNRLFKCRWRCSVRLIPVDRIGQTRIAGREDDFSWFSFYGQKMLFVCPIDVLCRVFCHLKKNQKQ